MEFRNGVLLQLIECIESTQNEVKKKMSVTDSYHDALKSLGDGANKKPSRPHAIRSRRFHVDDGGATSAVHQDANTPIECHATRTFATTSAIYNVDRLRVTHCCGRASNIAIQST